MADTLRHIYQVLTKRSKRLVDIAGSPPSPGNVWMGVSLETQAYAFRVDHLRAVSAAVRILSLDLLLTPSISSSWASIGSIAGGESGLGCRPVEEG